MRFLARAAFAAVLAVACLVPLAEREARACGGCFHISPGPGETPSVITDHRMILSISSQQTTLYDQIRYQGNPSSFAWVLPISGEATVGLSADVVFASLDAETSVTVHGPTIDCPGPKQCPGRKNGGASLAADAGAAEPPVTVIKQETVGPYETVQLKADDPNALVDWLTSHSFVIPDDVKPIIAAYTNEHFGFLAMKLVPGSSVQAMRPVRVSTPGASPTLPLRMVAAGTGATVGITLWVVGEGRYETQNFPSFTIDPAELVWDFNTQSSNYTSKRAEKEQALGGRGWQVESSVAEDEDAFVNLVETGGRQYGQIVPASDDYDPQTSDGGVTKTADEVRDDDLTTLFAGMNAADIRITRLRSDLAHSVLSTDLVLRASTDQRVVQRDLYVTQSVNAPSCPVQPDPVCPPDETSDGGISLGDNNGSSNGKESFSCAATVGGAGSGIALGVLGAFFGLALMRKRRRST